MKKYVLFCLTALTVVFLPAGRALALPAPVNAHPPAQAAEVHGKDFREYIHFFEEVYKTMAQHYYHRVDPEGFKKFIYIFDKKIYSQLKSSGKTNNYIKWRSAAFMVKSLKNPDDIFTAFFPPQFAKKYKEEALGERIDLGIEGKPVARGYKVSFVEPRSNAYAQGIRDKDILTAIDGRKTAGLNEQTMRKLLQPVKGSTVKIAYLVYPRWMPKTAKVLSEEYFKQTVFRMPVDVPGVYGIRIKRFNRMTSEDMTPLMEGILRKKDVKGLILDLRGNPGGPPLAAMEISAFFLPPEEFAYFRMKDRPSAVLNVPAIPPQYRYRGGLVILVNKGSGSAAELFTGVLQDRGRAILMGTNTAGQVFLKHMFHFDDGSMLLLVTARGFMPDGKVFPYSGLTPNKPLKAKKADLVHDAAVYLLHQWKKTHGAGAGT